LSIPKKEDANNELKESGESVSNEEMEKREEITKTLNEEALREKYPLIPEKRTFGEPNTEVVIATAKKVTEDLGWIRQESMKESLERKLEGTYDPYQQRKKDFEKKKEEGKHQKW